MKGRILSFRRGLHTQKNTQIIIKIEGIENKEDAEKMIGKKVYLNNQNIGVIKNVHGNKGKLRVLLNKGLSGEFLGAEIEIKG